MASLKELNADFNEFDEFVRKLLKESGESGSETKESIEEKILDKMKAKWFDLFDDSLDDESAIGILEHYKESMNETEMKKGAKRKSMKNLRKTDKTKKNRLNKIGKQKGGMAPIGANITPGFPTMQTYGSFPSDITTNSSMAKALDIIGGNPGLSSSCGKEADLFPKPDASMGSNKVGGSRQTKKNKTKRKEKDEKQTGGGLLDALSMRAYLPTIPPNTLQTAQTTYQGVAQPPSGDPTDQAWKFSATSGGVINPAITKIGSDINQLASPAPWGKS